MTTHSVADDLATAFALADTADRITLQHWRTRSSAQLKPDGSLVTVADVEVDAAIVTMLGARRPADGICAEESGRSGDPDAERVWFLDPLDQTVNFSRGLTEYATLIALYDGEGARCAVVSAPALAQRWWATRGGGAYNRTGRLRVAPTAELTAAVVSIAAAHRFGDRTTGMLRLAGAGRATTGSGGFLAHMRLAEGAIDLVVDPWGEVWDLAASALIVTEAGGTFTALDGAPTITGGCALASNGVLHTAALAALTGMAGAAPTSSVQQSPHHPVGQ